MSGPLYSQRRVLECVERLTAMYGHAPTVDTVAKVMGDDPRDTAWTVVNLIAHGYLAMNDEPPTSLRMLGSSSAVDTGAALDAVAADLKAQGVAFDPSAVIAEIRDDVPVP